MEEMKIYYTGCSALIPQRFWSYTAMTGSEWEEYQKTHDVNPDIKRIPFTQEKWDELTKH